MSCRLRGLAVALFLSVPILLHAQSAIVTAPKLILVSGEQMQLGGSARDNAGNPRTDGRFSFNSLNSAVISVDAAGIVTAKNPGISSVTANIQGTNINSPAVLLQVVPSRIDVSGGGTDIRVGESRQFTAVALDINSQPIPGVNFRWQVTGANGFNTRAAAIDSAGLLTTNGIGVMTIRAQIAYSGQSTAHIPVFEGLAVVTVRADSEFKLTRLLANTPINRGLPLRPAFYSDPGINDLGQIAFAANLDGLGNALMFYENGRFDLLASAGTPSPQGGYIWTFEGTPAINNRGDVAIRVGTSHGWGLLRASKASGLTFMLENGTSEGFGRMTQLFVGRNSLNDRGDMVFVANYQPPGATAANTGLFSMNDTAFTLIWSSADPLPGFPADYRFDNSMFGVDRNGTAYFRVTSGRESAIFRADGVSAPFKIAGTGMSVGAPVSGVVQIQDVLNLALSPNGTLAFNVTGPGNAAGIVRLRSGERIPEYLSQAWVGQVLSVTDTGETLYVGSPGREPWNGVYAWQSGIAQVLRFSYNSDFPLEGGENPTWARIGKLTSRHEAFMMLNSPETDLLMVRSDGRARTTLWKTGTMLSLNANANLNFQGIVPGAQTGALQIFGGGSNPSILEVGASAVRPIWSPGDRPAPGVTNSIAWNATRNPDGTLYLALGDGIVRFLNGRADALLRFPMEDSSRVTVSRPTGWWEGSNSFAVNSAGTFVFNALTNSDNRIELYDRGVLSPIAIQGGASATASPGGGRFSGISSGSLRQNTLAIDERGRVMMNAQVNGGPSGLFLYENGQWKPAALLRTTSVAGAVITDIRGIRVAGEMFYAMFGLANGDALIAQYAGQTWTPLVRRADVLPDGTSLGNFNSPFAVNRRGDIVFSAQANGQKIILRTADGVNHLVYSEMALTDSGDRLPNQGFEFDIRDNRQIYFTGFDSTDRSVVYKATSAGTTSLDFSIADRGGNSITSSGNSPTIGMGYGSIQPGAGSSMPSGMAIFGFRPNNVLVSEASVPASPAIRSGRIYAEVNGSVNTGLAMVNPGGQDATVSYYFTDPNGAPFDSGTLTIPAKGKVTGFLNQAPFNGKPSLTGSFTFSSTVPIAVVALRGLTNERGDFLIAPLPVADLSTPAGSGTVIFPHFADGAGWTTQVILVNPGNTILTGSVQFRNPSGTPATVTANGQTNSTFTYSIPAGASFKLQTSGSSASGMSGSVSVVPSGNTASPSGLEIFSYRNGGITVTEVGVPAQPAGTAFRLYAETAGVPGSTGSIQTGLAVTNNTSSSTTVSLALTRLDGSSTGLTGTLQVPANGQVSTFLYQIPGFATLQNPFQGVLRVSSAASISVIGLRTRFNERGDFLASSTLPVNEASPLSSAPLFIPQIVDGGGYTTQFILFSGRAGQSSSGAMELFSESGAGLNLTVR